MRRIAIALVLVSAALGPMLPARVAGAATGRMYILPVGLVPQSDCERDHWRAHRLFLR